MLCVLSGCRKETDPGDVTILFWVALSEGNWEEAKDYSTQGSEDLFSKDTKSSHIQIGKVNIHYNQATVETYINREYAAKAESFKTYLIRIPKNDHWKVDYPKTYQAIKKNDLKSLVFTVKAIGAKVKIETTLWFKNLIASLVNWMKSFFKKD
ncbi:MAG: hypothetical protein KAU26_11295 [Methylococcales bacterium]|nr:hypothetical protein [Methylococcales bacterium]